MAPESSPAPSERPLQVLVEVATVEEEAEDLDTQAVAEQIRLEV